MSPRIIEFLICFIRAKLKEIQAGVDGVLVFDPNLVKPLQQVSNSLVLTAFHFFGGVGGTQLVGTVTADYNLGQKG